MRKKTIANLEQAAENSVSALEYESLFDEALDMARDLKDIEKEVRNCALCDGRGDCSMKVTVDKDAEFRNKIVEWLKANNWYAVLHDGHWARYFHIRALDETCKGLTNEIYGAFFESFVCEFDGKGKFIADYNFHLDANFSWEWLYKRVVLKEQIPEDRRCSVCGKELTGKEYYTCTEHTKPIKF